MRRNFLEGKTAYLSGCIKLMPDSGMSWRSYISRRLRGMQIKVIDPCKKTTKNLSEIGDDKNKFKKIIEKEKWGQIKEAFWPIVRYDLRGVDRADFIIVNYDPDIPTIGTIHELVVANFEKKPILLKYDKEKLTNFNPWMCVFIKEHHFFSDWDKLMKYLGLVNKGEFDTSLWVI